MIGQGAERTELLSPPQAKLAEASTDLGHHTFIFWFLKK
uniref:Uncharacterized protein n=1 Tax=viral metagenome TaxID=1070528 RepID=A0A6C0IBP4_9ZZZZ